MSGVLYNSVGEWGKSGIGFFFFPFYMVEKGELMSGLLLSGICFMIRSNMDLRVSVLVSFMCNCFAP
jgi:hypothetical protein